MSLLSNEYNKSLNLKFQFRQAIHYFHSFEADGDDAEEEIEDVFGVIVFNSPIVGIICDTGSFVGGNGIAFHNPFDSRFAIDDVFVCFERDVRDGDFVVIDDAGFIVFGFHFAVACLDLLFRKSHLANFIQCFRGFGTEESTRFSSHAEHR